MIHRVVVESTTFDELKAGKTATLVHKIVVDAPTFEDARLLACYIVHIQGRRPTLAERERDYPELTLSPFAQRKEG